MAVLPHTHRVFCLVTLLCHLWTVSILGLVVKERYRRQTAVKYDLELQQKPFSEDYYKDISTHFYDFNSATIDGKPASSFAFDIVTTTDSKPQIASLFRVDNQILKFGTGLSTEERKNYFDYDQYPTVVVTIKAVHSSDPEGTDPKYIKLTIPLTDVNDEKPVFKNQPFPYLAAIPVSPSAGDTVYVLFAEDPDTNADLKYSIEDDPSLRDYFRMENVVDGSGPDAIAEGHIKIASGVAFTLGQTFKIPVKVEDRNGILPQTATSEVDVLVGPRAPQFFQLKYEGSIFESEIANKPVYMASGSADELIVKVHQFQEKNPITFQILEDNYKVSKQFRIDETGKIFNKERLDYDIQESLRPPKSQLVISVSEKLVDGTVLKNTVPLAITIKDENDNPPRFQSTQYQQTIPEDTAVGLTVIKIVAEDIDSGKNSDVSYEVENDYFDIQKVEEDGVAKGAIIVKRPLDFDDDPGPIYRFIVVAKDNGSPVLSSSVDVFITTSNTNDEKPVFEKQDDLILRDDVSVSGSQKYILTRLRAKDVDGDGVRFYFKGPTSGQTVSKIFEIEPTSGVIKVSRPVPANIDSYILDMIVVDDGTCCSSSTKLTSEMSFRVEIVDSVNQKPFFDNCLDYTDQAAFKEEDPPDTPVITVSASDTGRGVNGEVEYSIESPNPNLPTSIFQINKGTGEITLKNAVDRELMLKNYIQITVKAADKATTPQEGWCTFRVAIKDINDQEPIFNLDSYTQEVPYNAPRGRVLLRVGAVDKDIGNNAKLTYSLVKDGNGMFNIYSSNGLVYLNNTLKGGKNKFTLLVKAQDAGMPPLSGTVEVVITVSTKEDTAPPKFVPEQSTYSYKVEENVRTDSPQAVITTLQCDSKDESESRVQFFLVDESGRLHAPKNGKFSIDAFVMSGKSFVNVSVAEELDYETKTQHSIILRCQNLAALTMYEEITLNIEVVDKNDEIPYFAGFMPSNGQYSGSVIENTNGSSTFMYNIKAYDDDVSEEFRKLVFRLDNNSYPGVLNDFAIQQLEGNKAAITTVRSFNREKKDRYLLHVIVDDGHPSDILEANGKTPNWPNTASVFVQVTIMDENDNPMKFKQDLYEHSVKETANIGDLIFSVTADDEDDVDKGQLTYSFTSIEEIPFDIRDQTGEIFVNNKLDYEGPNKEYLLTLKSGDRLNKFTATTQVKITVTDENDNIPLFKQPVYNIKDKVVEEDTSVSKTNLLSLIKVAATDADVSRTVQIRYRLRGEGTEPGDQKLFTINELTGEIFLMASLDRDKPIGKAEYTFTVEALDEEEEPQIGYANVKVFPIDINDNKPKFDEKSLFDTIPEHTDIDQFITQVKATDMDFGKNAELEYEIVNSPSTTDASKTNYFRVESNGRIISQVDKQYLDRETVPELKITVRARDRGDRPQSATAVLTIQLSDINDNAPVFTRKQYDAVVSENTKSGIIVDVLAKDMDIEDNAKLRYSIAKESAISGHFKIDTDNNKGYISIYRPVDYEKPTERHFELKIQVQDKDEAHIDYATVNITVEDFNDNAPEFENKFKTRRIKEGTLPGRNITTFEAFDTDSGINAIKSYLIDPKTDERREFYIDPESGEVWTRKSLDREVSPSMNLEILAVDKGDPQLTGTATLSIIVEDVNDNYPIFKEDYRPVVMENMKGVTFPLHVQDVFGKDLDTDRFGSPFGFALPDPCDDISCAKFKLAFNPDGDGGKGTATITTNLVFDREEHKIYKLPIIMWDMRGLSSPEAQTGTNTLTITIGDINDNKHFPGHQDVFVYNYKGQFGPLVVGRVYVKDKDDWDLPSKTFKFINPASLQDLFEVDSSNGDITMKKGVKSNFGGFPYRFSVSVKDSVSNKTVVSTVSVVVKDLTEEAVMKSGSVRFSGMTSSKFILEPVDTVTDKREDSLYTKFRRLMAMKLGYLGVDNVELTTLRDGDGYLEVRYAAHASPYITPAEVDNTIIMNKVDFESLGLKIKAIPVDECLDEIFEGGCFNKLTITGNPVTVNANGTSYVGVEAFLVATKGCEADTFPSSNDCTGDYCYNGGTCKKDNWGTLSCENCPKGFTGARCQDRRHSFSGTSVAFYKTLQQCEESQTSIEFITTQEDGVILYNGPMTNVSLNPTQDFILLMLVGGYPVLVIDHGTGVLELNLNGKDLVGMQLLQKLNDGEWHHIDINRNGKTVEVVVDRCSVAQTQKQVIIDNKACRVKGETPGVNMYLNVNTLLQLGGVKVFEAVDHLKGRSLPGFKGCLRNFIHNKQLYNLNYRPTDGLDSGKNGCPQEDAFCRVNTKIPACGIHGKCEASLDGQVTCVCHAGYWGIKCDKETTIIDLEEGGYYMWKMKDDFYNSFTKNREITVHIRFRTRETSGNLVYLYDSASSSSTLGIKLMLADGKVRLAYNLGGGEKQLDLVNAHANNGQWHTLTMERYGTEFHLRLDGGEGRNYNYTLGTKDGSEKDVFKVSRQVFSGAYKEKIGSGSVLKDDLFNTCIQDMRVKNGYFAMTLNEAKSRETVATVEENPNTKDDCRRDDCKPQSCKIDRACIALWGDFECRCLPGFQLIHSQCRSLCNPNPCFRNVACSMTDAGDDFKCKCSSRFKGKLCDELGPEEVYSSDLSDTALVAIIIPIIMIILIAVVVVLIYHYCGRNEDGEKYILEVDPEGDIRENIMNYDEEGAGEKDQDAYDISRLQKPSYETPHGPYDPDKRRDIHRRDAGGDRPDVGVFIEDRKGDADDDNGAPPHDSVREFTFEGGESDAGSLSSLNTSSSDRSQDYDYLNEWGPKFSRLADMYGAGQDLES